MTKFLTISKNTFIEIIRQPIFYIIIAIALFLFIISPSITMYTLDDDDKLLREIGLSTLFLVSLFIAIFSSCGAVGEEIENKTILTVLSKPVPRPLFIFAKFTGVMLAVTLAHYICSIALLLSIRHGCIENVNEYVEWTVVAAGGGAIFLSIALSAFLNYFYDWRFTATNIITLAIFSTIALCLLWFIDRNWQFNPAENGFNTLDILGSLLLLPGALIIAAIAVAVSARFNTVITLSVCAGVFLLGLVTDYTFGQLAGEHLWAKVCYFIVPNLQVFWISDAIYEGTHVTMGYMLKAGLYSVCYCGGILAVAVSLFQRRSVG
jgi:ABC-type transport system involved in multi-copper enzyme maturation permease subunit